MYQSDLSSASWDGHLVSRQPFGCEPIFKIAPNPSPFDPSLFRQTVDDADRRRETETLHTALTAKLLHKLPLEVVWDIIHDH